MGRLMSNEAKTEFALYAGNGNNIMTPGEEGFDTFWCRAEDTHLEFRVRACQDAVIGLSSDVMAEPDYQIVLGANQNQDVQILNDGVAESKNYIDILDCDMLKTFWASWQDGRIEIGTGALGTNRLLHYEDPNMVSVEALTLATRSQSMAEWDFPRSKGQASLCYQLNSMVGCYNIDEQLSHSWTELC